MVDEFGIYQQQQSNYTFRLALHHDFSQQRQHINKQHHINNYQHINRKQHLINTQHHILNRQQQQFNNIKDSLKYIYKNTYKLLTQQDHNNFYNTPTINNNISTTNNNMQHNITTFKKTQQISPTFNYTRHNTPTFNVNTQHTPPTFNNINNLLPTHNIYNNDLSPHKAETDPLNTKCLPPCRICNDKASGFHYGLNTCEACKGFFRRCMKRRHEHTCEHNNTCVVTGNKRGQCSACRYRKCLRLGMSIDAIKTGRYTHEKKQKDLEEVENLRSRQLFNYYADEELDKTIQNVCLSQVSHLKWDETKFTLSFKESVYLEQKKEQEKLFGSLSSLAIDDYLDVYNATGIDVDGRLELVLKLLPLVEPNLRSLVRCARSIPGFHDLDVSDQIDIIKASRVEVWILTHHHQFNPHRKLFTTLSGIVVCYEELLKVYTKEYLDILFETQADIQKLKMSFSETCVLAGLVIMSADTSELTDRYLVGQTQDLMLSCFMKLLQKRMDENQLALYFGKIVEVLMKMKVVKHLYAEEEKELMRLWFDKVPISPLIYELWAL